jgi:hypothetical protein
VTVVIGGAAPTTEVCLISAAKQRRRRQLEILWVSLTVLYGLGRAVVVGVTLGRYGVNPWIYAAIDAATSVPLGLGTARATTAAIDRRWKAFREWTFLAAVAFIAPDVSIFVMGGGRLPRVVFLIVGAVVLVTASLAIREGRLKVREGRRERLACELAAGSEIEAITAPK